MFAIEGTIVRDDRLSYAARGYLFCLLSHMERNLPVDHIADETLTDELVSSGYAKRVGYDVEIFDSPQNTGEIIE